MFYIGSRDSALAMFQAREVQRTLTEAHGAARGFSFEIISTNSLGDRVLDQPLAVLAGSNPGLFTKELEGGLASGAFDIAVHSLKDMPTSLPGGLTLAAITEREAEEDVLLVHPAHRGCGGLAGLPAGALVGTSSVRRRAIVMRGNLEGRYEGLRVESIRGNLQTRLRKLDDSTPITADGGAGEAGGAGGAEGKEGAAGPGERVHYDAIILAAAGVRRLGWDDRIENTLDAMSFPYGVSQGALGIECREDDALVQELVRHDSVQHLPSAMRCSAERSIMRALQGGCQMAMGVVSSLQAAGGEGAGKGAGEGDGGGAGTGEGGVLSLQAWVLSEDGDVQVEASASGVVGSVEDAEALGVRVADSLREAGADEILGPRATIPRPITYSEVAS